MTYEVALVDAIVANFLSMYLLRLSGIESIKSNWRGHRAYIRFEMNLT